MIAIYINLAAIVTEDNDHTDAAVRPVLSAVITTNDDEDNSTWGYSIVTDVNADPHARLAVLMGALRLIHDQVEELQHDIARAQADSN